MADGSRDMGKTSGRNYLRQMELTQVTVLREIWRWFSGKRRRKSNSFGRSAAESRCSGNSELAELAKHWLEYDPVAHH
jgi:hypothetical protein